VAALQRELGLERPPRNIQAFDISTIGGQDAVGSLVVFRDGRPARKEYRRFRIKTVVGQDDVAMIGEVVSRRFRRVLEEKRPLPQLVLVDGGQGQLRAAQRSLQELGLSDQPVAALAKRLDEVFLPRQAEAISIPKSSAALRLLQRIRDEAHRFAVEYHRQLRSRRLRGSELEAIPGVGRQRAGKLLRHFGSLRRLQAASLEELRSVPGLGEELARRVRLHLNGSKDLGER
jgi:excinuclease ABC subunit C